jgi:dihydrolipoamide dehydrogenase
MTNFDVIVIGGGPGGYVCAIRCSQLGLKTACIDASPALGGTCLNVGCIPSKALLHASHQLHEAKHNFAKMGLISEPPIINWKKMQEYKDIIIRQNTQGIEFLFKKNKVQYINGHARFTNKNEIQVDGKTYTGNNIVIATGSEATSLPGIDIDEELIVSSTGALSLKKIPNRLVVIGGGVIGLELSSVYNRLGTEVTVLEYQNSITPEMDKDISKNLQRILKQQGIKFETNCAVNAVRKYKNKLTVKYKNNKTESSEIIEADIVLVATGRKAHSKELSFEEIGGTVDERGGIETDIRNLTNLSSIYAIGDVTNGPMLAHKAEEEGIAVAETIAGQKSHINFNHIPNVIYTNPEVASVGMTEEMLKENDKDYKVGKFNFAGNGRAKLVFSSAGFVKLLTDNKTDRILGCHIIGPNAGDIIHEVCVAMEFGASAQDLAMTCHAHPTFSEAIKEAALSCGDGAIHS